MPSLHPIEIRFFPRLPRISPWFILCGLLFSALLSTSLSSYFFPFLLRPAAPDNVRGDIIETSVARGSELELDRIAHIAGNDIAPRSSLLNCRQNPDDRVDEDGFLHFGDDLAEFRLSNSVNVWEQPIQTVHVQDVVSFPLGEVNDIPGVFAACARPCMKKAVELNTDCEDPLDLECTCRPEVRAVIEAASDECCWQACGRGVAEILWRPCWNEDKPLHY
ncbi:hypothetical protein QBC45DRAFT_339950 [Copromyces sp. CBS 386.78]|nr:hypothetical protein QBC45DRAFT_339950 [Copromyces sp. CBS 386.78]